MQSPSLHKPQAEDDQEHRHAGHAAEATGLLILAVVLLVVMIIRYWHAIPWSAR